DFPVPLSASRPETPANRRLALLIQHDQIAFDLLLAVLLDLVGDLAGAGDDVARPYAGGEADLEAAHVADSDVVGHRLREQPRREHPLREHGRDSGRLDEGLIVMQWDEVARRAGVADEIGAGDAFDLDLRNFVADFD